MSDVLEVAEVVTERAPVRTLLWSGGVVEIKVSGDAETREVTTREGEELRYLRFQRGIRGGHINCFLHTKNAALRGTRITARVEVWQKELEDGRRFLYLDFRQTRDAVTHRLVVMPGKPDEATIPEGSLGFETPETSMSIRFGCEVQSMGTIILSPVEKKVVPEVSVEYVIDRQLGRLLAADWMIQDENDVTVTLYKIGRDGKLKELVHHRPKKNGKRK